MTEATKKRKKRLILEAYKKKGLNISLTCKSAGIKISRVTFNTWRKEDGAFNDALEEIEEGDLDEVETNLRILAKGIPKIEEGKLVGWKEKPNLRAVETYLKVRGRKRGYGDIVPEEIQKDKAISKSEEEIMAEIKSIAESMKPYQGGESTGTVEVSD